jgi:hypothetical protein
VRQGCSPPRILGIVQTMVTRYNSQPSNPPTCEDRGSNCATYGPCNQVIGVIVEHCPPLGCWSAISHTHQALIMALQNIWLLVSSTGWACSFANVDQVVLSSAVGRKSQISAVLYGCCTSAGSTGIMYVFSVRHATRPGLSCYMFWPNYRACFDLYSCA